MPRTGRPTTFAALQDKDFLVQKYVHEKLSTVKIAQVVGCDAKLVNYRLRQFGILTRNFGESHRIDPFKFIGNNNVLYGSLLGDGSLLMKNRGGQGWASFSKSNINYDHVFFVGRKLLAGGDPTTHIDAWKPKLGRTAFRFKTRVCEEFLKEHIRWYPEKKIVPADLKLNREIILHWFLDDGHSSWRNAKKTRIAVGFSTESFTKEDCEYLCGEFKKFDCDAYLQKSHGGYGYKIFLRANSHEKFFDLMGSCPPEISSMQYKWKLPWVKT